MLMPVLSRMLLRTLIAAAVLFAVAAPASAKVVYRWKTDDGVYAFTDDAKRIPEKYRTQAKTTPLRPLRGYKNYTPAQRSGTAAYLKQVQKSAVEMSRLNARLSGYGTPSPGAVYGAPGGSGASLWVGTAGQSNIQISANAIDDSDQPIVIQQKRFYIPGFNSTRTDTVITQGDHIISVTKPLAHQDDISTIPSESVLP